MCTHYTCIYTIYTPLNTSNYPIYTLNTPYTTGVRESAGSLLVTAMTAAGCVLHGVLRNTFDATGFFVLSVNGYV